MPDRPALTFLPELQLGAIETTIIRTMIGAFPKDVTTTQLVDRVYGHDPEGGPLSAAHSLKITIVNLRKKLRRYGWSIKPNKGGHGVIGRYQLEPIPA